MVWGTQVGCDLVWTQGEIKVKGGPGAMWAQGGALCKCRGWCQAPCPVSARLSFGHHSFLFGVTTTNHPNSAGGEPGARAPG